MEAPVATTGTLAECLNAELGVGSNQEGQNLISVSVPIDTLPTNSQSKDPFLKDSVIENGTSELANTGKFFQNNGEKNTFNKEASRDNPTELDDSEETVYEKYSRSPSFDERKLVERRRLGRIRLAQSKEFLDTVQERVSYLEKRLGEALNDHQLMNNAEGPGFNKLRPVTCDVALLNWANFAARVEVDAKSFSGWKHRAELDHEPKSVIEILIEEPRPDFFQITGQSQIQSSSTFFNENENTTAENAKSQAYQIRIRSKLLLKIMKEITGCRTTGGPYGHRLLLIRPFKLLVRFEKKLRDKLTELQISHGIDATAKRSETMKDLPVKDTDEKETLGQLTELCSVIDQYFTREIQLYQELSPEICKVQFDDLWYIFKPGYEVRTPGDTQIQLYRILNVTGGRKILAHWQKSPENAASEKLKSHGYSEGSFVIECVYFNFDGIRFGPVHVTFFIRRFDGEKSITALPVYPMDCDPNKESIREHLLTRGKKFTDIADAKSIAHHKYNSLTLDKTPEQVDSEVIIDFGLAFLQKKDNKPNIGLDNLVSDDGREFPPFWDLKTPCKEEGCCGNDYIFYDYEIDESARASFKEERKEFFESTEELDEDQIVLLPPQAYGFILRTRRWVTFDIDKLKEPDFGSGWEDLVVNEDIKDTVLALVENHLRPHDSSIHTNGVLPSVDLVQGKGRGLIILLHGEPGVGKTSTAECVATHTKRPLFPITCGDLGNTATDVEMNLQKNFQLAHKWGCVLLLDEADIFLSARSEQDIKRNSIVSVFLRTLEYYSGILFLTTNRVGQIDRAFKSRIHLSLRYEKLNMKRTIRIWENNLKRVERDFEEQGWTIESEGIIKFAKEHYRKLKKSKELVVWNGRQIRNAFQTAIAIAAYEAKQATAEGKRAKPPKLTPAQFRKVAQTAENFDRYLTGLCDGLTDPDLAKQDRLRDDDFLEIRESKRSKKKERKKKKSDQRRSHSDSDESSDGESNKCEESEESQESEEETEQSDTAPPVSKRRKRS